jgi:MFS family permease
MMVLVHIVPYAIDTGISSTTAAGALSIFVAISMLAQLIAGFMVDKVRGIRVLLFSITAAMISLFVLPFTVNTSMLFLFAVLLGITGAMNTLQTIVTVELFGTKYLGTVLGVVLFFGTVGGALGPIFGGSIFDNTGSYNPAFITCSCIGIVVFSLSLLLARVVRENKKA